MSVENAFQEAWKQKQYLVAREHAIAMKELYEVSTSEYKEWDCVAKLCQIRVVELEFFAWHKDDVAEDDDDFWIEAWSKTTAILNMYKDIPPEQYGQPVLKRLLNVRNCMGEWEKRKTIYMNKLYPHVLRSPTIEKVVGIVVLNNRIMIVKNICRQSDETKVEYTTRVSGNSMLVFAHLDKNLQNVEEVTATLLTRLQNASPGITVRLLLSDKYHPLIRITINYSVIWIWITWLMLLLWIIHATTVARELEYRWNRVERAAHDALTAHDSKLQFVISHEHVCRLN